MSSVSSHHNTHQDQNIAAISQPTNIQLYGNSNLLHTFYNLWQIIRSIFGLESYPYISPADYKYDQYRTEKKGDKVYYHFRYSNGKSGKISIETTNNEQRVILLSVVRHITQYMEKMSKNENIPNLFVNTVFDIISVLDTSILNKNSVEDIYPALDLLFTQPYMELFIAKHREVFNSIMLQSVITHQRNTAKEEYIRLNPLQKSISQAAYNRIWTTDQLDKIGRKCFQALDLRDQSMIELRLSQK